MPGGGSGSGGGGGGGGSSDNDSDRSSGDEHNQAVDDVDGGGGVQEPAPEPAAASTAEVIGPDKTGGELGPISSAGDKTRGPVADANHPEAMFERRGIALAVINVFVAVGKAFADVPRFLLAGGGTAMALTLVPETSEQVAVQPRELHGTRAVVRAPPERVARSAIVRQLKAAVGDRVLVRPDVPQGQPGAPQDQQLVRATVVGYDPAADTYQLLDCTVPTSAHECNHMYTLGWSAAGANERWVAAANLELDKNFTTKDACEELIKPLVAPYSTSMVELLERRAQTDPALRAALADPAQAGLVAQGFRILLSSEGGDCPVLLVGLASVFDSHAWM